MGFVAIIHKTTNPVLHIVWDWTVLQICESFSLVLSLHWSGNPSNVEKWISTTLVI